MDWRYKHFNREAPFKSPRSMVVDAARSFMGESLGWKVADTPDGFEAQGYSFAHGATAKFRIESAPFGTRVAVELLVERAGPMGFMLVDVGGYYNRQITRWLEAIQFQIHQKLTSATQAGPTEQAKPPTRQNKLAATVFHGCLLVIVVTFAVYFLVTLVLLFVGLFTARLYIIGKGSTLTINGIWARVISGILLLIFALLALRFRRIMRPRGGVS